MKHAISARWLANPNQASSQFLHDFWSLFEYLVHYQSEDWFLCSLGVHIGSPIMLTIEPRMSRMFWARNSISFKHKSFWCQLDPHLTTYHSNRGVQINVVFNLDTSASHKIVCSQGDVGKGDSISLPLSLPLVSWNRLLATYISLSCAKSLGSGASRVWTGRVAAQLCVSSCF